MQPFFDIAADLDTPVSAYLKLRPFKPRFLLESVEGGERLARYSFIGFGEALEVRLDRDGLTIGNRVAARPTDRAALLAGLRSALAQAPVPKPDLPSVPLAGGLVGAASYDIVRFFERLEARTPASSRQRAREAEVPDAHFVAPRSLLVFDHLTRGVALLHDGPESERQSLRREVIRALRGAVPEPRNHVAFATATASLSEGEFVERVRTAQEYIAAGDIYQLVLSIRFAGTHSLSPFEVYRALRLINPSPYMYFCELGALTVVGSSPEALVRLNGRQASLRPIAGTRPRGTGAEDDARYEQELRRDAKENAEHVMLVDLARNDLGRVARAGSIRVEPYRAVERYSHVMHLVSGVNGTLDTRHDAFDLFAAAFPAGTLVGAPKVRAMEIIDELEPVRRGLYGGTVGYFGARGDMDQAITIRTLVFEGDRYSYQAGAGIVADSSPAAEYAEVLAKGAALRRALEMAREGI
jgi:anthranilate synthase component 1